METSSLVHNVIGNKLIEYICFANCSGYSQASLDYIKSLDMLGAKVKLNVIHKKIIEDSFSKKQIDWMRGLTSSFETVYDCVQIRHIIPPRWNRLRAAKNVISISTFETFDPPSDWIPKMNQVKLCIFPSEFNVKTFINSGLTSNIVKIPHCFNDQIWHDNICALDNYDNFSFLCVGTWRQRKNWKNLLKGFLDNFNNKDNVQLVIKTDKPSLCSQEVKKVKHLLSNNRKDWPKIIVETRVFDEISMARFIKSHDCLISASLGEGFCLPPMQAMAVGVPSIVSNVGGCGEYANDDRCVMIEPEGYELIPIIDNLPQFKNKKWARITEKSIYLAMKKVLENKSEIKKKAIKANEFVHNNFNYRVIGKKFIDAIEEYVSAS
jgi:glycosyltransferase involved in cell wall biosynthesis